MERLFLDEQVGVLRQHPGCVALEYVHVAILEGAIEVWKETFPDAKPGFSEGEDADLATMTWLAYWMHWALEQCVQPSVENR
ncbi:hypothetical protein LZC95_50325 [Pendulispora brunnea]|uniref:Uncharacterized protein n=1 Tax=Pendulispora brunnea TaxID=2905690 RepID=A0ABZ2K7E1_9BACT